jgi:AcrR family transcriptional regulator
MIVGHNTKGAKRPRGRPQVRPDEETRQLIVSAAREEFHTNGYERASMVGVAQRAGVSTKTMYRLIPTKADLFQSIVTDRISGFMLEMDDAALDALPIEEALEHILISYASLTLDDETTSTLRLVFAECGRFPEIASAFSEFAIRRTTETMQAWLERQADHGRIAVDDAPTAIGMLRGMMIMEPQRALMLGQRTRPDEAEIAARARFCARLFLDGCRPRPNRRRPS